MEMLVGSHLVCADSLADVFEVAGEGGWVVEVVVVICVIRGVVFVCSARCEGRIGGR